MNEAIFSHLRLESLDAGVRRKDSEIAAMVLSTRVTSREWAKPKGASGPKRTRGAAELCPGIRSLERRDW